MGYVWSMYGDCGGYEWGELGKGRLGGGIGDLVSWGIGELGTGDLIGGFDCGGDGHAD